MPTASHLKRVLPILVLAGMTLVANTRSASAQQAMNTHPGVSSGNNQFAFDLFKNVASTQKDANIFFSPLSISTALVMAYAGSQGETQEQMAQVLHFQASQEEVANGFHSLTTSLSQPAKAAYQLRVANALWAQKGAHFQPDYISLMDKYYSGDFKTLNFAETEESRAAINHWVADKTAGKIPQLLQPGDINALTRLVLTNAVYFKGDWTTPFDQSYTQPAPFAAGTGTKKQVPMMHQTGYLGYAQVGDLQALELPYRGDQLSMLILLPRADAPDPWADFTWEKLQPVRAQMHGTRVEVFLPRFKVEERLSLGQTLSGMGMRDAFERGAADFSGITGRKEWSISAVVHQAVIEVNEKGTEAAAATGVVATLAAMRPSGPAVFRADHPFLYMIIHKPSDSILFMGLLSDPPH